MNRLEELKDQFETTFASLPIWDQKDALESVGFKLKLQDGDEALIESEKERMEKLEEIRSELESKAKARGLMADARAGVPFGESWRKFWKK